MLGRLEVRECVRVDAFEGVSSVRMPITILSRCWSWVRLGDGVSGCI